MSVSGTIPAGRIQCPVARDAHDLRRRRGRGRQLERRRLGHVRQGHGRSRPSRSIRSPRPSTTASRRPITGSAGNRPRAIRVRRYGEDLQRHGHRRHGRRRLSPGPMAAAAAIPVQQSSALSYGPYTAPATKRDSAGNTTVTGAVSFTVCRYARPGPNRSWQPIHRPANESHAIRNHAFGSRHALRPSSSSSRPSEVR